MWLRSQANGELRFLERTQESGVIKRSGWGLNDARRMPTSERSRSSWERTCASWTRSPETPRPSTASARRRWRQRCARAPSGCVAGNAFWGSLVKYKAHLRSAVFLSNLREAVVCARRTWQTDPREAHPPFLCLVYGYLLLPMPKLQCLPQRNHHQGFFCSAVPALSSPSGTGNVSARTRAFRFKSLVISLLKWEQGRNSIFVIEGERVRLV